MLYLLLIILIFIGIALVFHAILQTFLLHAISCQPTAEEIADKEYHEVIDRY